MSTAIAVVILESLITETMSRSYVKLVWYNRKKIHTVATFQILGLLTCKQQLDTQFSGIFIMYLHALFNTNRKSWSSG
jgi:hypothetical protein